jgi:hypothetical protein
MMKEMDSMGDNGGCRCLTSRSLKPRISDDPGRECVVNVLWLTLLIAVALPMDTVGAEDAAVTDTGVPFELEAHRIFVHVTIGDSAPLRLFLDTGLTYPGIFLFHKERIEELDLPERIDVLVPGAGDEGPSRAVMADSVDLRLGNTVLPVQWVVISLSERTQSFPSEGIIGGTLFNAFSVEVDYASMRLRLHDPDAFSPDSSWTALPIELRHGIPWLEASVSVAGEDEQPLRTYIDLADDFPLSLLTGAERRFTAPADGEVEYLGTGLSGDIHGKIGEVARLQIGPFTLEQVRTAFAPAKTRSKQDGADAILGNGLLEHFHVVFDYRGGRLLLKPGREVKTRSRPAPAEPR